MQQISGNNDRPNRRSLTIITPGRNHNQKAHGVYSVVYIRTLNIGRIYTRRNVCAREIHAYTSLMSAHARVAKGVFIDGRVGGGV